MEVTGVCQYHFKQFIVHNLLSLEAAESLCVWGL